MSDLTLINDAANALFDKISQLIDKARKHISTAVNITEVYTRYHIGQYIIEEEQDGNYRAQYGKKILANLSGLLTAKYGSGWSVDSLEKCRTFFHVYSNSATVLRKSDNRLISSTEQPIEPISATVLRKSSDEIKFTLSWSHYLLLMRIENVDERNFYEIEATKENWSVRHLQRQYSSSLYERLVLSRNKDEVMRLSREGLTLEKPQDIIKNPLTLEFLGLQSDSAYSESTLETAVINKLQKFLLEMGKGFLFEARQKRFTFNEDHFYVDLVLYNRLLQCFVLIDFKIDKLVHNDLGQMQMYVNYYDRYVKQDYEKPTIGILLCKEKNDALVELTLPKDANIFATEYQLYLPDKQLLQAKVKEWIQEFEDQEEKK
jgi:predicted nuclease of restriction endonuclease-like (RecB) superfamily